MKGKFMIIAALLGALTFGACVDNNESDSVVNVRNAKAEELKSIAALNNAKAQAELIAANADAALKASQAAINEADAAIKEAQARYHEALAEAEEIQNEQDRALLEAKIAEYEAEIAKWQMMKAQYVAQMERDAIVAEKALLQAQIELLNKEQKFNEKLAEIEAAEALVLKQLYQQYASEARNLNVSIGKVNQAKKNIADAEAGIITAEEAAAKSIANYEEQIAADEAQIAKLNEFLAVIVEEHGDEILTDAEVKELYEKTYVEYLKALEAEQAALKVKNDALDAYSKAVAAKAAVNDATDEESPRAALSAARAAYKKAYEAFIDAGGLLALNDDESFVTGLDKATSYGFYTTDKLTGVNSVYNEIIAIGAFGFNEDEDDDVLDGTYEYELYTLNEKNLEAYVTALKGENYTAEQKAKLEKDVKDAQATYDKAVAAVPTAEKAAADAKAAYVTAVEAKLAADAAVKAWDDAMDAVVTNIDEAIEGLEDDYNDAVDALNAADDALKVAEAAWIAAGSPAKGALYDAKESAKIDLDIAQSLKNKAESEMNFAKSNRALNIKLGQANLGDGKKEKAAVDAAETALTKATNAYVFALQALGEAPQYTADGEWDPTAEYFDGAVANVKYTAKNGKVTKVTLGTTTYATLAKYLEKQVYIYVGADKKTHTDPSAHAAVIIAADDLAFAKAELAKAEKGNAEFVENVDKLIADVKETAAAFEAAVKAFNEAWAAADEVVVAAEAAKKAAEEAHKDATTALNAVDDVLGAIGIQHTECAEIYENLTKAIAYLEAQIERWKAAIEAIEADTETYEATIATNKAELEILEVEVEVQTIYVENAKAALDAALAEYAGSDETVTE